LKKKRILFPLLNIPFAPNRSQTPPKPGEFNPFRMVPYNPALNHPRKGIYLLTGVVGKFKNGTASHLTNKSGKPVIKKGLNL